MHQDQDAAIAVLAIGALALVVLWFIDDSDPEISESDAPPVSDAPNSRDEPTVNPPTVSRELGPFFFAVIGWTACLLLTFIAWVVAEMVGGM